MADLSQDEIAKILTAQMGDVRVVRTVAGVDARPSATKASPTPSVSTLTAKLRHGAESTLERGPSFARGHGVAVDASGLSEAPRRAVRSASENEESAPSDLQAVVVAPEATPSVDTPQRSHTVLISKSTRRVVGSQG